MKSKKEDNSEPSVLEYAIVLIITGIITMAFLPFIKTKKVSRHGIYLIVLLIIGICVYWFLFVR